MACRRILKAINNLNLMLMIHMGHLGMLIEDMNKKLLTIKIIESSKSLKNKMLVWFYQVTRGIKEILKYVKEGIKTFERIKIQTIRTYFK